MESASVPEITVRSIGLECLVHFGVFPIEFHFIMLFDGTTPSCFTYNIHVLNFMHHTLSQNFLILLCKGFIIFISSLIEVGVRFME